MATREFQESSMDPSQDPLWHRIDAFDFGDLDPALQFVQRLARENGWKPDYAARVVEEYKRFCYLAVRAGHAVFPSEQVDQVWLLHLSYSQDYWNNFCAKILGTDLHHNPPWTDEPEEVDRHRHSYAATMKSYERLSGERPPSDIWPIAELLYADNGAMRRVNTKNNFILRRPAKGVLWVAQIALIVATIVLLWEREVVIALFAGVAAVAVAIFRDSTDNKWITKPWRDGDDDGTPSGGGNIRGI